MTITTPNNTKTKITISNTQVTAKNTCGRMHGYAYYDEIQAIEPKSWLYRGVIGHAALDAYYFEMREGSGPNICLLAALDVIQKEQIKVAIESPEDTEKIDICSNLNLLIKEYAAFYQEEPFRIISIEEEFRAPLIPEVDFMLRLDMLVEYTSGKFRGDLVLFDHKFKYNFITEAELDMDAQLPKYIETLTKNGYVISKGIFNQLRWRKDAVVKFQRSPVKTTFEARQEVWKEQQDTAEDIIKEAALPVGERNVRRVLNPLVCKYCDYQSICKAEMNGTNTTQMRNANFKKRDRGFKIYDD